MLGEIEGVQGILICERAAFSPDQKDLDSFIHSLSAVQNLGANDIYAWFLGWTSVANSKSAAETTEQSTPPDLKLNLIYPCTEKHIDKYRKQNVRYVSETPLLYHFAVRPFISRLREEGRLNWVFNILDGRTEQEDVILREHQHLSSPEASHNDPEGFLLLPDLNWDRRTLTSLHLLAVVTRRDIWSLRDLRRSHVQWLRGMRDRVLASTTQLYPSIDADELKLYVHYQPTYHHFHVHVVHAQLEAGTTQSVGKAWGFDALLAMLELLRPEQSLADITLAYAVGENAELWKDIFAPLKARELELPPQRLYKILPTAPVPAADLETHIYPLSDLDRRDGFIHLSTATQVPGTAARFFAGATELYFLVLDPVELLKYKGRESDELGNAEPRLRLEAAGAGRFWHLYGRGVGASDVFATTSAHRRNGEDWVQALAREKWT